MNTDVTAQAMAALRERCKALHQRLGRDAMLRQNDPVETLFSFAKGLIDDREYIVGFNAGWDECAAKAAKPLEPTQREEGASGLIDQKALSAAYAALAVALSHLPYNAPNEDALPAAIKAYVAASPLAAKPDAIEEAVLAEREACARVAEYHGNITSRNIARAIRARLPIEASKR